LSNLINAGAYVLDPKVFDYIPEGRPVSLEREVFPKIAQEGKLYSYKTEGLWIDIGKPKEYLEANKTILDLIVKSKRKKIPKIFEIKDPTALDKGIKIDEKSVIGPYAIIGKNVKIGKHVQITNSVIFEDTEIGDETIIDGAIIGEGARIGSHVKVGKNCIVADQAKIRNNVNLSHSIAVCPAKEIH